MEVYMEMAPLIAFSSIGVILYLAFILVFIAVAVLFIVVLLKLNKALDIWLANNQKN